MSPVYLARPVTFSTASTRGTDVPTTRRWGPVRSALAGQPRTPGAARWRRRIAAASISRTAAPAASACRQADVETRSRARPPPCRAARNQYFIFGPVLARRHNGAMGLGYIWFRVLAQTATVARTSLTSPQTRRLAMLAPLVAVAFTAGRSWNRRTAAVRNGTGGVLVIVARHRPDLYAELSRACHGSSDVRVIVDRRGTEAPRKAWRRPWRGADRRRPQPDGDHWASSGVKVVVLPAAEALSEPPRVSSPG